jgi:NAD(P)-dependent dehydrogenase (short-subunit alcohol dehydrogenase family)
MRGFDGETFVVTGAAHGIGEAIFRILMSYGARVIAVDVDPRIADVQSANKNVQGYVCDLNYEDQIEALTATIRGSVESVSGIANIPCSPIFATRDPTFSQWELSMRSTVASYSRLIGGLLPIVRRNRGSIVNMASISASIAQEGFGTYSAAKAAVVAYTRCLALECGKEGIRANSISPGTVWTKNNAFHLNLEFGVNRAEADQHPSIGKKHILGRCADPEEIGDAAAFLLSTHSSFITGHDLLVDGGYTAV